MAVYAHELSHNLSIPDNYNNPFAAPPQRTAGGMWDMMSRGSFNGPGGQHTRWHDPADPGRRARRAAQPAQQALPELHRRRRHPAAQPQRARAVRPRRGRGQGARGRAERRPRRRARHCSTATATPTRPAAGQHRPDAARARGTRRPTGTRVSAGLQRLHDGGRPADRLGLVRSGPRRPARQVQDRRSSTCGSFSCFVWYIDSNPQDINQVDYVKADGTPVKATLGDERQTNDGSFNAGVNSGSSTSTRPPATTCTSTSSTSAPTPRASCATRSASARSPAAARRRAASASARPPRAPPRACTTCTFPLKNTGAAAATDRRCTRRTPRRTSTATSTACRRVEHGTGWTAHLKNALATAKFGETVQVPVYIDKAAGARRVGLGHADGDVGERPVQDDVRLPARAAPATPWAAPSRRRSR